MRDLNKQIEKLEQEIVKLKEIANKKEEYVIEYIENKTYFVGTFAIDNGYSDGDYGWKENARYRHTKEQANISLARNKRANRLEALAMAIGGAYEWEEDENNYFIYYINGKYATHYANYVYRATDVYMTKETAIKVCEILNAGRYSLEGDK